MLSILLSKAEQNGCFSKGLRPLNPAIFELKVGQNGCFSKGLRPLDPAMFEPKVAQKRRSPQIKKIICAALLRK